jgi:hypothetical protein
MLRGARLLSFVSLTSAVASLAAAAPAAAADVREAQLAQALFDEARKLMDVGRYAEACPKLAESQALDPGGGTLLNLAICHEREGRLATAYAEYVDARAVAAREGHKGREQLARERIAALEAAVPRIAVVVPGGADVDGLEIRLDGLVLRRPAWGVATPVDPGTHRIEATAPGRAPFEALVPIAANERKTVEVALSPLPPLAAAGAEDGSAPRGARGLAAEGSGSVGGLVLPPADATDGTGRDAGPSPTTFRRTRSNPVYIGVAAATVVSASVSLLTGILAVPAHITAKAGCNTDRNYCRDDESREAADRSRTLAWWSTGTLAAAALGTVLLFVVPPRVSDDAPASGSGRAPLRVRVGVLPGGAGVSIGGAL